jgi:hypothetical protein
VGRQPRGQGQPRRGRHAVRGAAGVQREFVFVRWVVPRAGEREGEMGEISLRQRPRACACVRGRNTQRHNTLTRAPHTTPSPCHNSLPTTTTDGLVPALLQGAQARRCPGRQRRHARLRHRRHGRDGQGCRQQGHPPPDGPLPGLGLVRDGAQRRAAAPQPGRELLRASGGRCQRPAPACNRPATNTRLPS